VKALLFHELHEVACLVEIFVGMLGVEVCDRNQVRVIVFVRTVGSLALIPVALAACT